MLMIPALTTDRNKPNSKRESGEQDTNQKPINADEN